MSRRTSGLLALGLACLLAAPAALAGGGGRVSDDDADRAREACEAIAENRDWTDIDTDVDDERDEDDRIVVTVRGEREGAEGDNERERHCYYDPDSGEARFEDQ